MLKSCSSFSPNAFFKAAIERKFESVATAFCVNRMLNCERIGTSGEKKNQQQQKNIVRRKNVNMLLVSLLVTVIWPQS